MNTVFGQRIRSPGVLTVATPGRERLSVPVSSADGRFETFTRP